MNQELQKEFVIFPLSIRMKKLGFDKPCISYYEVVYNPHKHPTEEPEGILKFPPFIDYLESQKKMKYLIGHNNILAPTWQAAFNWAREKYGVHIVPTKYSETEWWIHWGTWTSQIYKTFEQAEQACLEKILEIAESN